MATRLLFVFFLLEALWWPLDVIITAHSSISGAATCTSGGRWGWRRCHVVVLNQRVAELIDFHSRHCVGWRLQKVEGKMVGNLVGFFIGQMLGGHSSRVWWGSFIHPNQSYLSVSPSIMHDPNSNQQRTLVESYQVSLKPLLISPVLEDALPCYAYIWTICLLKLKLRK